MAKGYQYLGFRLVSISVIRIGPQVLLVGGTSFLILCCKLTQKKKKNNKNNYLEDCADRVVGQWSSRRKDDLGQNAVQLV